MSAAFEVPSNAVSVTDAAGGGVSSLVRRVESGDDLVITRRGEAVAVVLGMHRFDELRRLEGELRDLALVMSRAATDTGERRSLDSIIEAFGYSRADLERELEGEDEDEDSGP